MPSFTDNAGRTWRMKIDVAAAARTLEDTGIDLLSVYKTETVDRLSTDVTLLVDVLYAILRPQADAAGISEDDFGRAMMGDPLATAIDALFQAVFVFYP